MSKLRLDPEHLSVETFAAAEERRPRSGTVAAHEITVATCPRLNTCGSTCFGGATCAGGSTCDGGGGCPFSYPASCMPNCTGSIC